MGRALKRASALLLTLLIMSWAFALGQNKRARFDPDGSFWILGQPTNEFSDFSAINLNAKRLRRLPSPGVQLNDGTAFRFKTLSVKRDNFTFTTTTIGGFSYGFSGRFLKGGVFGASALDEDTPVLEGVLTKFKSGKKIADAKLKFVYFGGT